MKRLVAVSAALTAAAMLSGCMAVGHGGIGAPAVGVLYTEVYSPVHTEGTVGSKQGESCIQSVLGLVATGDASIKAAAKAGGITKIASIDHYTRNILGVLGEYCTIVRGS